MKFSIIEKQKLIEKGYVMPSDGFNPRENIAGDKVVIHSDFVKPLGIDVIAEYEHDDSNFLTLMQSEEWADEGVNEL